MPESTKQRSVTGREERLLSKVRPHGLVPKDAKWQQLKSGQTRQKIFDAAIACLVEASYSGLSIPAICTRSGVSRGALHHHFAGKLQLVAALTEYLFYKRMHRFITDYLGIIDNDRNFVARAAELHWESLHEPDHTAYLEIAIAARTDPGIAEFFYPMAQRFDQIWLEEMVHHFPQWEHHFQKLQLVSDFVMAAHMGLLLNSRVLGAEDRVNSVRDMIVASVLSVYAGSAGTASPPDTSDSA